MNFIKKNFLVICAFIFFILLVIIYINKSFVDVPFLDGLMPLPMVEKYFQGKLSFRDMNMRWGEHRLIGYSLIYLVNAILFGLNIKVDAFLFLLTYFLIGVMIYFFYKRFFINNLRKDFNIWIQISYISILSVIFSLMHPPIESSMTVQFVIGTLFFIISAVFFDQMCLDRKKIRFFLGFLISIAIYILIFSGAYFGGALFSLITCLLFKFLLSKNKKISLQLIISVLLTVILIGGYMRLTSVSGYDGNNLFGKILVFLSSFGETFKAFLAGLSGITLDIHTFSERLKSSEPIILINGCVLLLLGAYSTFRFITLKIYKKTYLPLLLIMYSIGSIFTIRLGRLNGGWLQVVNDWYSFHLYFYLIGSLWILYFDLFKRFDVASSKSLKNVFWHNKVIIILSLIWLTLIFSVQSFSNVFQWIRAPYVYQWFEVKRQAILFPDKESLKTLLWNEQDCLKAIAVLKKYKLSVFRPSKIGIYPGNIIKSSAWNPDGWIGKDAKVIIVSGKEGVLLMNTYLPKEIYSRIYKSSLQLIIILDGIAIKKYNFSKGAFDKGPVGITINIPKNKILSLELKIDKSYVPAQMNLGKDLRELGIIIQKLDVK